jgi:hypothetical protein
VTLGAKAVLLFYLLILLMMVGLGAHEAYINGDGRVIVGAAFLAFLTPVVVLGILIFDIVYRWTGAALRNLRAPTEQDLAVPGTDC